MTSRAIVWAGFAAGVFAFAGAASGQITNWSYGESHLRFVNATPEWQDYDTPTPTVGATPLFDGLHVFGTGDNDNVFSLTGATYVPGPANDPDFRGNQLVISGAATFDGSQWQHPDDLIRTSWGIGFGFSGGTLAIYRTDTSFTLLDADDNFLTGVGSGWGEEGLGTYEPGGYGVGWAFEDRFGANYETATHMLWSVTIGFDWTGYGPGDTFDFSIPQNSIDFNVVPSPGAFALAGIAGLGVASRRRR